MKKLSKKKIREAVRVVGYLLETNQTTKVFARNRRGQERNPLASDACKFCLVGATDIIARNVLKITGFEKDDRLSKFHIEVEEVVKPLFSHEPYGFLGSVSSWDNHGKKVRDKIIKALKNA